MRLLRSLSASRRSRLADYTIHSDAASSSHLCWHSRTRRVLRRNTRRLFKNVALCGALGTAAQGFLGSIGNHDNVFGAKLLPTSIALELVAANAQHPAAFGVGAGSHFEKYAPSAIFVVFHRKALEECVAVGAGGGR